jgi:hypothetical protein
MNDANKITCAILAAFLATVAGMGVIVLELPVEAVGLTCGAVVSTILARLAKEKFSRD